MNRFSMKYLLFLLFGLSVLSAYSQKGSIKSAVKKPSANSRKISFQFDVGQLKLENHSFSNYKSVQHKELSLDLSVDFLKKQLSGTISYKLDWHQNKQGFLILDSKDILVEKVTGLGGIVLPFKVISLKGIDTTVFGKALVIMVPNHDSLIEIKYKTVPATMLPPGSINALQWLDNSQTKDKEQPFLYSQSQAILARSWIPCQDVPAVKFKYHARVFFPGNLNAVMSANSFLNIDEFVRKHDSKVSIFMDFAKALPPLKTDRVLYFDQPNPICSYLMALAVGKFDFVKLGKKTGVYSETSLLNDAAADFSDLQKMVDSASALYGQYAWGDYNVLVLPPSFPFGGMENPVVTFATPTIITHDKSLVSLLAHELAHSWSGNLVTNETWNDFWLNEGFTNYFENRIMQKIYGIDFADMLMVLAKGELDNTMATLMVENPNDTKLKLDLQQRNPDDGLTDIAYEKGRFFLLWCEQVLGRKRFDLFLKSYFSKYQFKTATTEKFLMEIMDFVVNNGNQHGIYNTPSNDVSYWTKDHSNFSEDSLKINKGQFANCLMQWIYQPGMPVIQDEVRGELVSIFPQIHSVLLNESSELAQKLIPANTATLRQNYFSKLKEISKNWKTQQWQDYLRNIRVTDVKICETLDSMFHFSNSTNSEIAFDWFLLSIKLGYHAALPQLEKFLSSVGRRKFVLPLYEALLKSNATFQNDGQVLSYHGPMEYKVMARELFRKNYRSYHSVTVNSLSNLFIKESR